MADPKFKHYALVIPEGFYNLAFEHEIDGAPDKQICTIGFGRVGYTLTNADLVAIAVAWAANIVTVMMSTAATFTRLTASDAGGVVDEVNRTDVGTEVGPFAPVSCAAIVEKRTGVSGRAHRGRMFLPVVQEALVSERGALQPAFRDGITDNVAAFQVQVLANTGAADLVLLHSKGWGPPADPDEPEPADPGNAPDPDVITSYATKTIIGTQRRRLR